MEVSDKLLSKLDSKNTTAFYWSVTILATLGGFLFGYDTTNIGSALPVLEHVYPAIKGFIEGYLVAGASLGAAAGALIAALLSDKYGRKYLLIADAIIYALGAILSGLTIDLAMLLISRTLIGIAVGADSAIATSYIAEYAPKEKRGKLAIMQQWVLTVGILTAYLVGILTFALAPGLAFTLDWRILLILAAVPALIGLGFRIYMPESPRWLILHEKFDKAIAAIKRFGIDTTEQELKETHDYLKSKETKGMTSGVKRAFLIVALFMMFQQITGINIPFYYGPVIIGSLHLISSSSSTVGGIIFAVEASSILAAVNVAATYIGFKLIDSFGRRSLALLGYSGMAFFDFLGTVLYLLHISIGLLIGFAGFIVFFAFGVGGTGWIIQGEYFPTNFRGRYASLIAVVDWISNFAIIEIFPVMDSTIKIGYSMAIFGVLSLIAVTIFYFIMPVTKGKSVEDITSMFENNTLGKLRNASKKIPVKAPEQSENAKE